MGIQAMPVAFVDAARDRTDAEMAPLREAVQAWLVGWGVEVSAELLADFEPLPTVSAEVAEESAVNRANWEMAQRDLVFQIGERKELPLVTYHSEDGDPLDGYWAQLIAVLVAHVAGSKMRLGECSQCGKAFASSRLGAMYCSSRCKVAAARAR